MCKTQFFYLEVKCKRSNIFYEVFSYKPVSLLENLKLKEESIIFFIFIAKDLIFLGSVAIRIFLHGNFKKWLFYNQKKNCLVEKDPSNKLL